MDYKSDIAKAVFQDGGVELLTKYITDCTKGTDFLEGVNEVDKASNLAILFTKEKKYKEILYNSKERLPFNHNAKSLKDSVAVDTEDLKSNLYNVVQKFMKQDSAKLSEIAEELEKNLSPREITLVASREVLSILEKLHSNPLRMLLSALGGGIEDL